jgi:hypothetical protein
MLAIDIPIAMISGFALAESGKRMLKSEDRIQHRYMSTAVLLFAVFFITPVPFYFFLGWPAWEVNFLWRWQDNIHDSPLRAGVSFLIFLLTVGPAYLAFFIGKQWLRRGRDRMVTASYLLMLLLVGVIVVLTRDITFNIASTYERYEAGQFYSFWSHPFFTGWLLVTIYFWGGLVLTYLHIRRKDLQFRAEQPGRNEVRVATELGVLSASQKAETTRR